LLSQYDTGGDAVKTVNMTTSQQMTQRTVIGSVDFKARVQKYMEPFTNLLCFSAVCNGFGVLSDDRPVLIVQSC
jgi:hypothetical protein